MAYPGALPSFAGFTPSNTLAADNHAAQHNLEQSEIVAIATKVGIGASTPTVGLVLTGSGPGTSNWSQVNLTTMVSGILPVANGGTGASVATGTGNPVLATSPTITSPIITTPTIIDFTSAQHDHGDTDDGGPLASNTVDTAQLVAESVTTDKIDNQAVTTSKTKPEYRFLTTPHNGTGTRSASASNFIAPGTVLDYTTGSTPEVIELYASGLINGASAGHGMVIRQGTTWLGRRSYSGIAGLHNTHHCYAQFEAAANTAYSFHIYVLASSTTDICNATGDVAQGYHPQLDLIAWGRT